MESKYFILNDGTTVLDLGGGVSRQILGFNEQIMMVKVIFIKGAIGTLHTHIHSQTTYCAGGSFEFSIGDETRIIKEGDAVYIPSDLLHGVVCLEAGILIDTFNPVRKDFL
jgi:quercetin dioxygenase-like cupin family protein